MITNKTAREFVIAKKLFPGGGSFIETDTASGPIASFETNMTEPIVNGVFEFNPVQEGTGDPSPSNPRAIHGYTGMNITQTGANFLGLERTSIITSAPSLVRRDFTENQVYVGITATNAFNNSITNNYSIGEDSVTVNTARSGYGLGFPIKVKPSTAYYFKQTTTYQMGIGYFDYNGNFLSDTSLASVGTFTTPSNCYWLLLVFRPTPNTEATYQKPCLILGNTTPTTYEPYTGTTYPISWQTEAGTVYGGLLNATTGELKPFKEYDSYNGETLTGPWLCSQAPYVAGTTPPTGSQVVDLGAYDTTVQLTPQEVRTLLGTNNIYHDCNGDSTITYKKSVPGPTTTDKRQFLPLIYGKKFKYNERRY